MAWGRSLLRQRTWVAAMGTLLVACSTPFRLPPLPAADTPVATPRPAPSAASAPPRAGAPASAPATVAVPVPVLSLPPLVATAPLPVAPAVPAAVAAHFPEPALSFATPAFEPGRQALTSDDELRAILVGLERNAALGELGSEVRVLSLGVSQAGQPIEALAFTRPPPPAAPAASGAAPARRPAVLVVAGQHGDEPAGTEALIVVAQELAGGRLAGVLDRVDVVLVPRANPDGANAFKRGAADGTDINRDHLLLRTPEARALTKLVAEIAPLVVLDLHEYPVGGVFTTKFGAVQRFDALLQYATTANMAPFVTRAAEEWFRQPLMASLKGAGLSSDWYATTSDDPADRTLAMGGVGPQIGRNADGLRNAVSLLVESRGGGLGRTDLKRRVQTQVVATTSVLTSAASHAADLLKLRQFVDRETASLACKGEVVVDAAATPSEYAYTMIDSTSGEIRRLTVAWDSALQLRVLKSRPRPCGYWLAAAETEAVRRLRLLGIDVQQLDELGEVRGETYRESTRETIGGASPASAAANAGATTRLRVQTLPALLDVAAGGYYVSLEQPLANLAVAVLEPEAPSSFAANGVIASVGGEARILQRPEIRMSQVP
jgi:Zinc carboxypeptidase